MEQNKLAELFKEAIEHRNAHDCSAYPYENAEKLIELIQQFKSKHILEIGTGMGFTSLVMASADPQISVDTIEKDEEHVKVAKEFLKRKNVSDQVNVINGVAETVLNQLQKMYNLIFFDGYQVHYEFLSHYSRLLKYGGILVLGNNHLKSKTSDQVFEELNNSSEWKVLEQFADTTVAQKSTKCR